ncbi:hypothetical protein HWV62_13635 [Athelia sp. TMB]|nr:hypothetical protein HWV62_13635 [Athelia sp. TMB]
MSQSTAPTKPVYPSIDKDHFTDDLTPLEDPIFDTEESRADVKQSITSTTRIPGLLGIRYYDTRSNCLRERQRISQALQLSSEYRSAIDPPLAKLSRPHARKTLVKLASACIDDVFVNFEVLHDKTSGDVEAARPSITEFKKLTEFLGAVQKQAQSKIAGKGQTIPSFPTWGPSNNFEQWRTLNDFEIIATGYRQDADDFVHLLAPYLPAGTSVDPSAPAESDQSSSPASNELETDTPTKIRRVPDYGHSISEVAGRAPTARFFNSAALPRADIGGSSAYLGSLLSPTPRAAERASIPSRPSGTNQQLEPPQSRNRSYRSGAPGGAPDNDPDDSDSDAGRDGRRPEPPRHSQSPGRPARVPVPSYNYNTSRVPHFDKKLKVEIIPEWDGDEDQLPRWIDKINTIAAMSPEVNTELGTLVPRRLTGKAETWYYSITPSQRDVFEKSWITLREAIASYWMNHQWLESQKIRAELARFREAGHTRETPTQFVIRKIQLIRTVYNFTDTECIRLIMREVPVSWAPIVQPHLCKNLFDFQSVVKYHEENLINVSTGYGNRYTNMRQPLGIQSLDEQPNNIQPPGVTATTQNPPLNNEDD